MLLPLRMDVQRNQYGADPDAAPANVKPFAAWAALFAGCVGVTGGFFWLLSAGEPEIHGWQDPQRAAQWFGVAGFLAVAVGVARHESRRLLALGALASAVSLLVYYAFEWFALLVAVGTLVGTGINAWAQQRE